MASVSEGLELLARDEPRLVLFSGLPLRFEPNGPIVDPHRYRQRPFLTAKRIMDVAFSLLGILFFAPVFIIISSIIFLSSRGPVIFKQARWGANKKVFTLYKFRTMDVSRQDSSGVVQTTADDDRVSGLGAFLRRTSLDELPQLFNVLFGDMSLVGPRPHAVGMLAGGGQLYEELVPYYFERNIAVPGLTGWAQVNGLRGPTVDPAIAFGRVDHDLAYIENASIGLDLKILLMTAQREFLRGSGF